MRLLFVSKSRAQLVKGGRRLRQPCPECHDVTEFREVEIAQKLGAQRAFRCSSCGELFALAPPAAVRERPGEIEADWQLRV